MVCKSTRSGRLLAPSRLRTVRERFHSYGSSISSRFRAALKVELVTVFVDIGHIAHLLFAAFGFRDLEKDFSFVLNVHRKPTMMATSVLILPNLFEPAGKTLHAAAELPGMKIFRLQVGIGVHSYFCMSDNRNVIHPQKFFVLRGEYPVSVSSAVPVVCGYPPFPLVGVTAFGPPPQQFIENIVDVRKRLTGTDRSMIVRPAPDLLVQLFNQKVLFPSLTASKDGFRQAGRECFQRLF